MMQATLAWSAFKNLPFRAWKPVLMGLVMLLAALLVVVFGGRAVLEQLGFGPGSIPYSLIDPLAWLIGAVLAFRLLTNPLILHFGDIEGATHSTARFATNKEIDPLTRSGAGLLIGRDKSGKLLRYHGPAHCNSAPSCDPAGE